jgi:hypothetical protein
VGRLCRNEYAAGVPRRNRNESIIVAVRADNEALGWLLATDRATAALLPDFTPSVDKYMLQANLLNRVRTSLPRRSCPTSTEQACAACASCPCLC